MGEEKLYIGTKLILGIPMSQHEFNATQNKAVMGEHRPGYRVTYPDGYVSWSPKEVFEAAYREVSEGERSMF